MKTTTLKKIERLDHDSSHWWRLLNALKKFEADDEPLPYSRILEACGLKFALWATRTEEDFKWVKELAIAYARHISYLMSDPRSVKALDVAERFLAGEADKEELEAARKDAYAAVIADVPPVSYAAASCAYSAVYYSDSSILSEISDGAIGASDHAADACDEYYIYHTERDWQEAEFLKFVG